jgi:hypothetical protein
LFFQFFSNSHLSDSLRADQHDQSHGSHIHSFSSIVSKLLEIGNAFEQINQRKYELVFLRKVFQIRKHSSPPFFVKHNKNKMVRSFVLDCLFSFFIRFV